MHWWAPGGFWDGGGFAMMIGMFFWLLIAVAAIAFVIRYASGQLGNGGHDTPLDVLKRRFAAGELTEEEFERRRRLLERPATT